MDKINKEELIKKEMKIATSGAEEIGHLNEDERLEKIASFSSAPLKNPYPSPFLNLSDMQLPTSTIEIFKWCKYYYTFDPLISGSINALATFPVTKINLEDEQDNKNSELKDDIKLYNKVLFKNLNIYKLCIEIGIDYFLYGNCFIMGEFTSGNKKDIEWSKMVRLDPSKMIIDYNPATGTKVYKWQVPQKIRDIVKKKAPKDEYDKIPNVIKNAVNKNKAIILNPGQIYHFNRATDSMGDNSVWGVPLVANVLKLLMYRNILRQAQEAIAREHIVPLRIYYLDATNNMNVHADFSTVAKNLAAEIQKSVQDPNYRVVSPLPVNVINAGGEGRSLLLTPEIEQIQSEILAGMNVPREFIFGGVSYSGSSISLRILENQFITYRLLLKDFIQNFIIRKMAQARGEWHGEEDNDKLITVSLSDLKMQDDVQQKQLIIQLNSAGKCSNDFMWKSFDMDPEKMKDALKQEALDAIELEAEAQKIKLENEIKMMDLKMELQMKEMEMQMKIQMMQQQMMQQQAGSEQQQMMQEQPTQENPTQEQPTQEKLTQEQQPQQQYSNEEIDKEIQNVAIQLIKLPQDKQQEYLASLPSSIKTKIEEAMNNLVAQQQEESFQKENQADMRPMPEKKPPRRDSLK